MNKSEDKLIVSVVVVTYNSSKCVLETLESIKAQTYPYLSLVITDDCSTDKTLKICKKWVDENKGRFVDITIIESPINTGISANGNRGERVCKTKWVKEIAGDDILMPDCIRDNVYYVLEHPNVDYLFSRIEVFGGKTQANKNCEQLFDYGFFGYGQDEQLNCLIFGRNCIPAATGFYNLDRMRTLLISNDERIPMLEDLPKWINCLKKGVRFSFMDKLTVRYRVHSSSLSNSSFPSSKFYQSQRLFYYYYIREEHIKRYGLEKVIEDDVSIQSDVYKKYLKFRLLPFSRFYSIIDRLKRSIEFRMKRF